MNKYAVQHIMDSSYCFPTGEHDITIRLRTAKDDISQVWIFYESKYHIQEHQNKAEMAKVFSGSEFDYYSISLHLEDTRLAYVFYLFDGKEYKYFSEDGLTDTYDYSKGYYNFFQFPYINKVDILPMVDWMRSARFYQIFVDRFNIGDKSKDMSYVNMEWGEKPTPKSFAGGDIKGITEKLDYIKSLGIDSIYLTPIFKSISNHKYDISDYLEIDKDFGTKEDLRDLVDKAHEKGMHIVLDAVFNHCSDEMIQFQDVLKNGISSKYHDWFIIDGDKPDQEKVNYETFASCNYMPKLDTSNPEVRKFLIGIAVHYINEYHIDGWRLDVSDEVSHDFWREFRRAVKEAAPEAVIIGENWHDASVYLKGDQYDSIMNYAFTKAALDYWSTDQLDAKGMAQRLNDLLARNSDTVDHMMLNLLDSHDTHRFFSEVHEDESRLKEALCLLYLYPGVPCIFYGTELKTTGGYDPDCRKCMDWDKAAGVDQTDIYKIITTLADLRKTYDFSSSLPVITADESGKVLEIRYKIGDAEIDLYINNTDTVCILPCDDQTMLKVDAGKAIIMVNGKKILAT
ncbi:MAG: glycoside hydrolase family 13 protein [Butyrivibrio sp.]|nr:glycoside hydrolase family 13 protein [Butyrivibrio sp.]